MIAISKRPARKESETDVVQAIRATLNESGTGVRVFRNNTGKLLDAYGRMVTYGLAIGSADLVGIVIGPHCEHPGCRAQGKTGRFFALEVKRPGWKPTSKKEREHWANQCAWGETVRSFGGFYAVVHSVAEALTAVEDARR